MPNSPETDAEKPRRRVSVSRKPAQADIPFEVSVAIAKAVSDLDLETLRAIVVAQEQRIHALSVIMFDFQSILRTETGKRATPLTKERFNRFVAALRKSVEQNVPDLAALHSNQDEVNDDMEEQAVDRELDDMIASTFGPLSDWVLPEQVPEEELDEAEDALERASAETEDTDELPQLLPHTGRRRRRS